MCNHWHLRGHCENGPFCQFQHEPKLSAAELNALRYKTRSLACKNRYCENFDCCKYFLLALLESRQRFLESQLVLAESCATFFLLVDNPLTFSRLGTSVRPRARLWVLQIPRKLSLS